MLKTGFMISDWTNKAYIGLKRILWIFLKLIRSFRLPKNVKARISEMVSFREIAAIFGGNLPVSGKRAMTLS